MVSRHDPKRFRRVSGTDEWKGYTLFFALFAASEVPAVPRGAIVESRTELITILSIGRTQPKRQGDAEAVEELKRELQTGRELEAIIVTTTQRAPSLYKFEEGHHRALACLALGFETIPANIIVVTEAYFSKYPIVNPPFFTAAPPHRFL
jgi:hypothetical protein